MEKEDHPIRLIITKFSKAFVKIYRHYVNKGENDVSVLYERLEEANSNMFSIADNGDELRSLQLKKFQSERDGKIMDAEAASIPTFFMSNQVIRDAKSFIGYMIIAIIDFYSGVCENSNLIEIEEELIELVTDHIMKGNIQKVVFSFFKLESDLKKLNLIKKYKEYMNMQPEHVGVFEQFALNKSSPIMELYQIMKSQNTKINESIIDEVDFYSDDENSNNFKTCNNYSIEDGEESKDKPSNENSSISYQESFPISNQFKVSVYMEKESKLGIKNNSINPFDGDAQQPPRNRLFSDKRFHNTSITIDEIKRRLKEKPYQKAIDHLRLLGDIEEPRKKLKLLGEVNWKIIECIDEFWKDICIDEEQLVITTDQMTLIYLFIVTRSKITDLFAHLKYITEFTTQYVRNSNLGFYLATYEHALYTLMQYEQNDIKRMKLSGVPPVNNLLGSMQSESSSNLYSASYILKGTFIPEEFSNPNDPFVNLSMSGSFVKTINS